MILASQIWPLLSEVIQFTHFYNVIQANKLSEAFNAEFCFVMPHVCEKQNEGFYDFLALIDEVSRIADKASHGPAGSGWRCLVHYGQIIASK